MTDQDQERERLLQQISDLYKDIHGVRPRYNTSLNTNQELRRWLRELQAEFEVEKSNYAARRVRGMP